MSLQSVHGQKQKDIKGHIMCEHISEVALRVHQVELWIQVENIVIKMYVHSVK